MGARTGTCEILPRAADVPSHCPERGGTTNSSSLSSLPWRERNCDFQPIANFAQTISNYDWVTECGKSWWLVWGVFKCDHHHLSSLMLLQRYGVLLPITSMFISGSTTTLSSQTKESRFPPPPWKYLQIQSTRKGIPWHASLKPIQCHGFHLSLPWRNLTHKETVLLGIRSEARVIHVSSRLYLLHSTRLIIRYADKEREKRKQTIQNHQSQMKRK